MMWNIFWCAANFAFYFIEGNVAAPVNMFVAGLLFASIVQELGTSST